MPVSEQAPDREDSDAESYAALEQEVAKHFGGKWDDFLKAVRNPAEILYFVLWNHCEGQAPKIEAWAKEKELPADWLPRFYGMLTEKGDFRADAVTRAPENTEPRPEGDAAVEASVDAAMKATADAAAGPKPGGDA